MRWCFCRGRRRVSWMLCPFRSGEAADYGQAPDLAWRIGLRLRAPFRQRHNARADQVEPGEQSGDLVPGTEHQRDARPGIDGRDLAASLAVFLVMDMGQDQIAPRSEERRV